MGLSFSYVNIGERSEYCKLDQTSSREKGGVFIVFILRLTDTGICFTFDPVRICGVSSNSCVRVWGHHRGTLRLRMLPTRHTSAEDLQEQMASTTAGVSSSTQVLSKRSTSWAVRSITISCLLFPAGCCAEEAEECVRERGSCAASNSIDGVPTYTSHSWRHRRGEECNVILDYSSSKDRLRI